MLKNSINKQQQRNSYPEFNKKKCCLGAFVIHFLQSTSLVWKFVGNLSNVHSLNSTTENNELVSQLLF